MNARLRQLIDRRAAVWSQVQDIQNRRSQAGYDNAAEDEVAYVRALDELDELGKQIETEERADRMAALMGAPGTDVRSTNPRPDAGDGGEGDDGGRELYARAFAGYLRRGQTGLGGDEQRALMAGYREERALATSPAAAGGFLVPTQFLDRMIEAAKAFGGLAQLAETITTDNGDPIQWPTNDDTSNVGAILDENTAVTEADLTFGGGNIGAFMYTSRLVRVSYQLLQDSRFDLDAWLPRKLGERIGRASAAHFATGTGTGQPQGLVTGLTKTTTTGTIGKIGYDDLVDLEHSIDPAYRDRARYVFADSVIRELRKVKDSQGRPLWEPSLQAGVASQINGRPYTIDNSLAAFANGSKSAVFGDIRAAYLIRYVAGAQTLRLAERYAEFLQVGFLGFQRLDAKVQDTAAAAALIVRAA